MALKKKEEQETIFNEQLEKCGVDYFDYYLLHNPFQEEKVEERAALIFSG